MYDIYNVVVGDTWDSIENMFGVLKDDILKLNGLSEDAVVMPGMQLVVPKKKKGNYLYYTVKKGDSIYSIAKEYDVDYKLILLLNGLDEGDYIYPNETLLIPNSDVNVYMTGINDTIDDVMRRYDASFDELLKDNEKIFLKPEQIIVFKKK